MPPEPAPLLGCTFDGYRRPGGKAGTRNYLAIISTVNCSATVSKAVARRFDESLLKKFPNVDGVVAFTYGGGCGMEHAGEYHKLLNRVLGGVARHPNIGGYLLIGLGCEAVTSGYLLEDQKLVQISGLPGSHAVQRAAGAQHARPGRHAKDGRARDRSRGRDVAAGERRAPRERFRPAN